ncbi:hypothetical protein L873DRAFT_859344 [Choiromyces venosus 120613-1]|uniref:Uncharacterized protein n=1 Tax=Choiromyces venosus 120613-1 TaxID=1336337 RepID=A0A3N4ITQ5_9PEZI|nr:hypothetical protein L873DRAFT_859344 [Choiromyces venosus 120613-1]
MCIACKLQILGPQFTIRSLDGPLCRIQGSIRTGNISTILRRVMDSLIFMMGNWAYCTWGRLLRLWLKKGFGCSMAIHMA